jgi:hypothetical protein
MTDQEPTVDQKDQAQLELFNRARALGMDVIRLNSERENNGLSKIVNTTSFERELAKIKQPDGSITDFQIQQAEQAALILGTVAIVSLSASIDLRVDISKKDIELSTLKSAKGIVDKTLAKADSMVDSASHRSFPLANATRVVYSRPRDQSVSEAAPYGKEREEELDRSMRLRAAEAKKHIDGWVKTLEETHYSKIEINTNGVTVRADVPVVGKNGDNSGTTLLVK